MNAPATLSRFRTLRANGADLTLADTSLAEIPVPRIGLIGLLVVAIVVTASLDYLRQYFHLTIPEPLAVMLVTLLVISITYFPLMIFLFYSFKARRALAVTSASVPAFWRSRDMGPQ